MSKLVISIMNNSGSQKLPHNRMKTVHKIVFGLIVLNCTTFFSGCLEDSAWNAGMLGLPPNSAGQTGESPAAPTGTEESAQ